MINKLLTFESTSLNPYDNLAAEEFLLRRVAEWEMVLYLWRNERTVVVGRNQNIWSEVNMDELEAIKGFPTRRLSGGGAVYHDSGNLNFTFVTRRSDFDIPRQTGVVLAAIRSLGFADAVQTGRNDLCIGERKFSGQSYYYDGDAAFHNGTILWKTGGEEMSRVLSPSKEKLASKGVKSVRSRTVNLSEIQPSLGIEEIYKAFYAAFDAEYKLSASKISIDFEDEEYKKIRSRFSSKDWIFNKASNFSEKLSRRYDWGNTEIYLDVRGGIVRDCTVYTDALDTSASQNLRASLIGTPYSDLLIG